MPQASPELRACIQERFGEDTDRGCIRYLQGRGWTLGRKFSWTPPERIKHVSQVIDLEMECIQYLIDEWDYDGIERPSYFFSPKELMP